MTSPPGAYKKEAMPTITQPSERVFSRLLEENLRLVDVVLDGLADLQMLRVRHDELLETEDWCFEFPEEELEDCPDCPRNKQEALAENLLLQEKVTADLIEKATALWEDGLAETEDSAMERLWATYGLSLSPRRS